MSFIINPFVFATPAGGGGVTSTQWRIYITKTRGGWPLVREIEMRATPGGADQCTGGTPAASHNNADVAFAFDDSGTAFQLQSLAPCWISYTFGSAVEVNEMAWTSHASSPGDNPEDFEIQYHDGSDWVTWWSVTGFTSWSQGGQTVFTKP